ncbi:MAG: glycosyltransferase family 2 protein [Verrucomicrobia bacterium]|nr:glycosyltransferase family 2 protein [Verrucomicrobiota bacterium]
MRSPRVSVGMPVYNGERHIRQAIESILTQDYEDFELIISDNASSDATGEICRSYANADARVRYYRNETNIGASPNHTRVFELAKGEYFKWAAHDDECLPSLLGRCVRILEEAPTSVVLVYPQCVIIDEEGRVTREYRVSIQAKDRWPHRRVAQVLKSVELGTPAFGVSRASVLRQTRLIDSFHTSDYVLFAELAMLGEIWEIPEILLRKRDYSGRGTAANKTMQEFDAWMDPLQKKRRRILPLLHKIAWEYVKSAYRLPLSQSEQLLCAGTALYCHYVRHNQDRAQRWRGRLARLIGIRLEPGGNA